MHSSGKPPTAKAISYQPSKNTNALLMGDGR
jgi:hypothetical protein